MTFEEKQLELIWRDLTAALDALKANDLTAVSKHASDAAVRAANNALSLPVNQMPKDYRARITS